MADHTKEGKRPIIIVKKRGGHHGGHHGGAWKVAYADFVTAMMAFFLVLWLVGQSDDVKQSVAGYFADPVSFSTRSGSGILEGGQSLARSDQPMSVGQRLVSPDPEASRAKIQKAGQEILDSLVKITTLRELMQQIEVEMTDEGLRITLTEDADRGFFESGSARLLSHGQQVVSKIGEILAPLGLDVAIEGHTDGKHFQAADGYSNWELSTDRANAARRQLEMAGLSHENIAEVRGYGSTRPKFPQNLDDPRNRRVAIVVLDPFRPGGVFHERDSVGDSSVQDATRPADDTAAPRLDESHEPSH
ncbi:MAG: flagellar motor protein MotB [Acidobacteriota bacterium]